MHTKSTRTTQVPAILMTCAAVVLAFTPADAITTFDEVAVSVVLTGRGQTPAVSTTAVGQCTGRLVVATGGLDVTCSSNVAGAGGLIITLGSPSGGGTELLDLGSGPVAGGQVTLSESQVAALLAGRLYVAVTSGAHPSGEIAGRISPRIPIGQRIMRFHLANNELVSTGSSATAHCALAVSADTTDITLICTHTVQNPTQLRVLVDGGVAAMSNDVQSPFEIALPVLSNQYQRFLDGDFGVVLTSSGFPAGELGNVLDKCLEGPDTLCLTDGRFEIIVRFTAPGQPPKLAGTVEPRSDDAGLFWFFNPSNWEVLVKVLDACAVNQNFWVFLSANTNVAFEATVFDTLRGRTRTFSNPQGQIADSVAMTNAFSCP
ncbi:MAG: CHRD domain-containing protein [Acidimicrobiales bacterium]